MEKKVFKTGEIVTPEFLNQIQDVINEQNEVFSQLKTALLEVFSDEFDEYTLVGYSRLLGEIIMTLSGNGLGLATGYCHTSVDPTGIYIYMSNNRLISLNALDSAFVLKTIINGNERQYKIGFDDNGFLFANLVFGDKSGPGGLSINREGDNAPYEMEVARCGNITKIGPNILVFQLTGQSNKAELRHNGNELELNTNLKICGYSKINDYILKAQYGGFYLTDLEGRVVFQGNEYGFAIKEQLSFPACSLIDESTGYSVSERLLSSDSPMKIRYSVTLFNDESNKSTITSKSWTLNNNINIIKISGPTNNVYTVTIGNSGSITKTYYLEADSISTGKIINKNDIFTDDDYTLPGNAEDGERLSVINKGTNSSSTSGYITVHWTDCLGSSMNKTISKGRFLNFIYKKAPDNSIRNAWYCEND